MKISDILHAKEWSLIRQSTDAIQTPFLIVNLNVVRRKYEELSKNFPFAKLFYAVKANPAPEILSVLRDMGSGFDIASIYELDRLLQLGIKPEQISYSNPVKKVSDIRYAYEHGIRLFTTDSECDIRNLAEYAPGAKIICRILTEGGNAAEWSSSRKSGCHPDTAIELVLLCRELGLEPYGISFHVGSQQRDIAIWSSSLNKVTRIFEDLAEQGIQMKLINMGGGLPAKYISRVKPMRTYAHEISKYLANNFGDHLPEIMMEPGRALVAEAGVLITEVIQVSGKSSVDPDKWVYIDAGKFNGMIETIGESIEYPVYCEAEGELSQQFILAGPTCDSQDILYDDTRVPLPEWLNQGDRIYFLSAGAYTTSYCSVEFNGYPPMKTYFVQ